MAFTKKTIPVGRKEYFEYYLSNSTSLDEGLLPGFPFEIDSIKLHLSTVHVSVIDFVIQISSILGSYYNLTLLSQAMNGVRDVLWGPDRTMILNYGDELKFSMVMSAANVYGLIVNGWAIL